MLNSIGPGTAPGETSQAASYQLDFVSLPVAVQFGSKGITEKQGLAEIKVNHIRCTFPALGAIRVIAEGELFGQLELVLSKSAF